MTRQVSGNYGGIVSGVLKRIRKAAREQGLSDKVVSIVEAAARSKGGGRRAVKIPRAVVKRLSERLAEDGRAVITIGRQGTFKVFSIGGHAKMAENANANKPWLSKSATTTPE